MGYFERIKESKEKWESRKDMMEKIDFYRERMIKKYGFSEEEVRTGILDENKEEN